MVHFPLMHEDTSFGFVDPNDVLWGCHILLAFMKSKHTSNINVSCCAKDSKDYLLYYIWKVSSAISSWGIWHWPRFESQVFQLEPTHVKSLGVGGWPSSCTPVHFQLHSLPAKVNWCSIWSNSWTTARQRRYPNHRYRKWLRLQIRWSRNGLERPWTWGLKWKQWSRQWW